MTFKQCSKCGIEKPFHEFTKNSQQLSGLNPSCKQCKSILSKEYAKKIPDSYREYQSKWQRENREKRRTSVNKYRLNHPEKIKQYREKTKEEHKAYRVEWRKKNKERIRLVNHEWQKNNREKSRAYTRAYREKHPEKVLQAREHRRGSAIPIWSNRKYRKMFYSMAKEAFDITGIRHHVDHIVPINSKFVCGLHCEDNMRVLPAIENIRKGNRVWPDMW